MVQKKDLVINYSIFVVKIAFLKFFKKKMKKVLLNLICLNLTSINIEAASNTMSCHILCSYLKFTVISERKSYILNIFSDEFMEGRIEKNTLYGESYLWCRWRWTWIIIRQVSSKLFFLIDYISEIIIKHRSVPLFLPLLLLCRCDGNDVPTCERYRDCASQKFNRNNPFV